MRSWVVWRSVCRRLNLKNKTFFKALWLALTIGLLLTSCEKEARILVLELEIAELVCTDGQKIFEGRILELDGIKAVSANIQTHKAQIRHRENVVSADKIKTHLGDFGFTIDGVAGNNIARGRLPQCCFTKQSQ